MKTRFSFLAIAASTALITALTMTRLDSVEIESAPASPVTNPPVERYLVIDTSRVPVGGPQRAAATLETILNDYGAQGWRVRTTMPPFIILAQ